MTRCKHNRQTAVLNSLFARSIVASASPSAMVFPLPPITPVVMPRRTLNVVLAALALLGPFAIHLFLPLISVVKVDFELSDATAQLPFSIGAIGLAFSTLAYGTFADRFGRRPSTTVSLLATVAFPSAKYVTPPSCVMASTPLAKSSARCSAANATPDALTWTFALAPSINCAVAKLDT